MVTLNIMSRVVNVIGASCHVMSVNTLSLCDIRWFGYTGHCSAAVYFVHWKMSLGSPWLVGGTIDRKPRAHASKQVADITCPGTVQLGV